MLPFGESVALVLAALSLRDLYAAASAYDMCMVRGKRDRPRLWRCNILIGGVMMEYRWASDRMLDSETSSLSAVILGGDLIKNLLSYLNMQQKIVELIVSSMYSSNAIN